LGSAFYSTASEIAIRMISPKPVVGIEQLVRERIRAAIDYRERFVQNTNGYRVIFSEGDFLPGLIVDRYNDILSVQVLTQAWDSEVMRRVVLSELQEALSPRVIVERVDPRVRKLEQLPERESGIIQSAVIPTTSNSDVIPKLFRAQECFDKLSAGSALPKQKAGSSSFRSAPLLGMTSQKRVQSAEAPAAPQIQTEFQMNGVRFLYDALRGQKTGAFLDQRENYVAAEKYARGEALDVFCYEGGFALHLARVCDKVTGVDSSRQALEAADQNAALNDREMEWIEANAFDLLRDYSDSGKKYDTIILDPPAFAKSRQNRAAAMKGYKELNLRALKMLRPGGVLVTCSCSYHVSAADLLEVLASATRDLHRTVRILENRGQAKDHPSVLGIPETAYLKCAILSVS
jgi:23S rRNA (cytosine1962-C5)-methyltransferase